MERSLLKNMFYVSFPADSVVYCHPKKSVLISSFNADTIYLYLYEYLIYILQIKLFLFDSNVMIITAFSIFPFSAVITSNYCCREIFVSSANNTSFHMVDTLHMSLMYRINSLGPNTDPWGMPQALSKHHEKSLHKLLPAAQTTSYPIQYSVPDAISFQLFNSVFHDWLCQMLVWGT